MDKKYTAKELDLLHAELYDILGETIRICRKHDIPYFVIGGTAIGALYDRAILPWDDDIDIGMARKDYNRFLEVAPRELGDSYFLSWIETDPHSPYYYAKVKKNNTRSTGYPTTSCCGNYSTTQPVSSNVASWEKRYGCGNTSANAR